MCAVAATAMSYLREGRSRSRGEALREAFRQVKSRSEIYCCFLLFEKSVYFLVFLFRVRGMYAGVCATLETPRFLLYFVILFY